MKLFNSKNFKRLLASYSVILILPFIVSAAVYSRAVNIMNKNAIKFSMENLNSIKNLMEKEFSYVDKSILKLSIKPELRRIINLDSPREGSSDMYLFYEFYNLFNNMNFTSNRGNDKIFLLINTNGTVFGEKYANFSFEDFYQQYFNYDGMTYEQWYDLYFDKVYYQGNIPVKNIRINNISGNYITSLYTLPIIQSNDSRQKKEGVIAYLFNADEIKNMLKSTVAENGGWAYIVDQNNQVLISTDADKQNIPIDIESDSTAYKPIEIAGEKMMVVYTQLPQNSWKFVSVIPLSAIKLELNQFRYISFGILAATLLVGMLISLFLSYRNTKPIHALMALLPSISSVKRNNEILCVENGIKGLITDNNEMKQSLLQQGNYLKLAYFEKLLRGDIQNAEELEITGKYIGIDLSGDRFIVMLIRINLLDQLVNEEILYEQDISRVFLDKALIDASGKKGYTHILNSNELAFVLSFETNEDYQSRVKSIIQMVSRVFAANFIIKPIFAIGNLYTNLLDVHFSLKEAKYAADYLVTSNSKSTIVWYKDMEHCCTEYYYTSEMEQKIINFTKLGQWEELKNLLNKVYLNTVGNKSMTSQMKSLVLADLCATAIKISNELKTEIDLPLIEKTINTGDHEQYYKILRLEYKQICQNLSKNKKSHNEKLKESILDYIKEQFHDSNLSVASLSKKFNLSETYFSQFFKEQTNETFSHYLERLRMDYANALLIQQKLSIDEISNQSGYNSTNTFRRAFRRVNGLSPTEYMSAFHKDRQDK